MVSYTIYKLPEGGFFVQEGRNMEQSGMYSPPLFAATELAMALDFIRKKLEANNASSR